MSTKLIPINQKALDHSVMWLLQTCYDLYEEHQDLDAVLQALNQCIAVAVCNQPISEREKQKLIDKQTRGLERTFVILEAAISQGESSKQKGERE